MFSQLLREGFSPLMQVLFARIKPPSVRATCMDTKVYMGMRFVIVFCEDVWPPITECLVRKCSCRIPNCLAICVRRHGQQHI
ncbi:hypothetical protein WL00_07820 [Burkholderia cepacia]|nr:hypothetical protein WL00_07820 [Burkholderia cepacia]KVX63358.1 hypothetical protein WL07_32675 [Burkholderia cepacia]